jgi:hypothetical protein
VRFIVLQIQKAKHILVEKKNAVLLISYLPSENVLTLEPRGDEGAAEGETGEDSEMKFVAKRRVLELRRRLLERRALSDHERTNEDMLRGKQQVLLNVNPCTNLGKPDYRRRDGAQSGPFILHLALGIGITNLSVLLFKSLYPISLYDANKKKLIQVS